jgi:hypothetical protein
MRNSSEHYVLRGEQIRSSFVSGLASLVAISKPVQKSVYKARKSNAKVLRGDFERIGADMFLAVANEKKREKAAS